MKTPAYQRLRNLAAAYCLAVSVTAHAASAAPAELLEKGIYAEETKGDLDAAILIYQQLIADTKVALQLSAQAQLRLAQCLLKKKRDVEATAAFEKLIRDFPNEKELVAKARAYLPSDVALQPVPWQDGERLQLVLTVGNDTDIGAMEYRATLAKSGGQSVWRVGCRMFAQGNSLSIVEVDAETFRPLRSTWKHALLGEANAAYGTDELKLEQSGKEPVTAPLEKPVYDNEQAMHVMRRLPLALGYKTTLPVISTLSSAAVIPIGLEVTGVETVAVPAGQFECFKVQLSISQTFWFSSDAHRYVVKFEGGGAVGSLTSIAYRKADVPVAFNDPKLGISLTAPPDWVIHRRLADGKAGKQFIHLLDAEAVVDRAGMLILPTASLSTEARTSLQRWAQIDFDASFAKHLKDAAIRSNSYRARTVGGRAGLAYVADYREKETPMMLLVCLALGTTNSEQFQFACAADRFEALRPVFERIVDSYRTK